jgi:hypothetical protein
VDHPARASLPPVVLVALTRKIDAGAVKRFPAGIIGIAFDGQALRLRLNVSGSSSK